VEAELDRRAVDIVVKGDADGAGRGDVDAVALGGVVDDLGRVAAAGGEKRARDQGAGRQDGPTEA
jgi:hypothetical protein